MNDVTLRILWQLLGTNGGALVDMMSAWRQPFLPSLMPVWNASQTELLNGTKKTSLGYYCIKASRLHVLILCKSSVIVFSLKNIERTVRLKNFDEKNLAREDTRLL